MIKSNYYISFCPLLAGLFIVFQLNVLYGLEATNIEPLMRLCISAEFDTTVDSSFAQGSAQPYFRHVYEKFFNNERIEILKANVNNIMLEILNSKIENLAIDIELTDRADSCAIYSAFPNYYNIKNTIWIDANRNLYISAAVISSDSDTVFYTSSKKLLKHQALYSSTYWSELEERDHPIQKPLQNLILKDMASNLVNLIDDEVVQGIIESSCKLRVKVVDFTQLNDDPRYAYLSKGLKAMVETVLSRSEAIIVYADENFDQQYPVYDSSSRTDIIIYKPNYIINGSYFHIDQAMLIDLKCIKLPYNRILASGKVSIETVSISSLSSKVTEISNRFKNTMMLDFHKSVTTMDIVPEPP